MIQPTKMEIETNWRYVKMFFPPTNCHEMSRVHRRKCRDAAKLLVGFSSKPETVDAFPQVLGAFPKSLHHMSRSARLYRKVWHMPRGLEKSVEMWRHSLWPASHLRPRRLYLHRDLPAIPHMAEKWSRLSRPFGNQSEIFRNHCGPKYANVFFFSTANILHIKDLSGSRLSADSMYSIYRAQLHGTAEDPSETNVAMKVGGPFLCVGGLALSCPPKKWGKLSQTTKKTHRFHYVSMIQSYELMVPMWNDHFFRGTAEI